MVHIFFPQPNVGFNLTNFAAGEMLVIFPERLATVLISGVLLFKILVQNSFKFSVLVISTETKIYLSLQKVVKTKI